MIEDNEMDRNGGQALQFSIETRPLDTELAIVVGDDEAMIHALLQLRAKHQGERGRHVVDSNVMPGDPGGPALIGWMVTRRA